MKKTLCALLLLSGAINAFAQTRADYDAAVNKFRGFYNNLQTDSIYNMLTDRGKSMLPADKAAQTFKQLYGRFGKIESFAFTKEKENIWLYKTVFEQMTMSLVLQLDKDYKLETFRFISYKPDTDAVQAEKSNIILKTTTGDIYGSLMIPDGGKKVPVVLMIAGSGPTDRNCNSDLGLKSNAFLMLADSLKKAGIASVRYDKRGVGESAPALKDPEHLTFDDYVNDATAFVKMLKQDERFSKVIILGHSEGSLIGMIAADKEKVAGYISVSGIANSADKILIKQLSAESKERAGKASVILDSLKKGYTVQNIDPSLYTFFSPALQLYMRSLIKYYPAEEIKKLKIPVLIVQGTTDLQVGVDEAELLKKAYPKATLEIVAGMNHPLKQAPADRKANAATYSNPTLPLSAGLMPGIVKFVKEIK